MKKIAIVALLFLAAATVNTHAEEPAITAAHPALSLRAVTDYLRREVDSGRIPGAVAAVSVHGKTRYLEAMGHSDLVTRQPMRTNSLFRIASMTKPITSAAVMKLVEDGRISLDARLPTYLPGFKNRRVLRQVAGDSLATEPAERAPTIRDLLTHQSGLTYGWFGPQKLDAIYQRHQLSRWFEPTNQTLDDRIRRVQAVPLKFQPGTAWDYGVSTDVLGRVIEVVSGETLEAFLSKEFLQPLKMLDTHFNVPANKHQRLATLYTIDEHKSLKPVAAAPVQMGFLRFSSNYCTQANHLYSGGAGLVSTAGDYLRFLHMLIRGGELDGVRVLKPETVEMMTQNHIGEMNIPFPGHGDGFGLGFGVTTARGQQADVFSVGTYSWGGIFNTYFWVDPQEQLVGVLMTQVFPNDHLNTREEFRRMVYQAIRKSPPQTDSSEATAPSQLAAYEQFALTHVGNAAAGERLFKQKTTQCHDCHRINKQGGEVGPDLSRIGGKHDRPHLVDALLYPSRQINYGYESTTMITHSGKVFSGVVKVRGEGEVTLVDATNHRRTIATSQIEEIKVSDVSIMPTGLIKSLSKQQFTDMIAYLESLGGGGRGKHGSQISGPIQLPDGFEISTVATGLSGATAMEIAADGRIFVCEQSGTLRVIKNGQLLKQPFVTIPVEMNWERGLIGVTVAPDFPDDPHVYVVYVTDKPYSHHRVSRFRADGDSAVVGSETILLRGDDQSQFGGNVPAGHQGGAIHFGADGKMYVGLGEQTAKAPAKRMDALQGKILRLNADGSIPRDNPFLHETSGKYRAIWAKGCRNPFTFAVSDAGDILINDVGGKYEEINRGIAGADYGWPAADHGPTNRKDVTGPIHFYPQSSINGGDFCSASSPWPQRFLGKYFFADFVQGWVKFVDPHNAKKATPFVSGIRRPVDLRFAPDGCLYVLLRNAWVADNKFKGETGSVICIRYTKS